MGAVDELGSRGLTHWSRAVINGLCFANTPRSPARSALMATHLTLKRDAGGVLVVQPGGAVWIGTATMPAPRATTWTRLSEPFTLRFAVYGHDHRVCGCVTNCVTITTYDHGLPGIPGDI
jgi:hypothetical protein